MTGSATSYLASLPMYDWPEIRDWTDRFWSALAARLHGAELHPPERLDRSHKSHDVWRDPGLLFSQTCGYPYAVGLQDHVALLGAPHYDIEGCGAGTYSCAVLVPANSSASNLEALRGQRFAYNGRGSLSGYRGLSPLVGDVEGFAGVLHKSGGHRESMDMLAAEQADFALIDAVCWWLYQRVEPQRAATLRVLTWTDPFPALPFITSLTRSPKVLSLIEQALRGAIEDMNADARPDGLPLIGLKSAKRGDYEALAGL